MVFGTRALKYWALGPSGVLLGPLQSSGIGPTRLSKFLEPGTVNMGYLDPLSMAYRLLGRKFLTLLPLAAASTFRSLDP